jgi:hypothetical protein
MNSTLWAFDCLETIMFANPLPMNPNSERLWLIGLLVLLSIGIVLAGVWMVVPTGTAAFQVSEASEGVPVNVTVEGPTEDGREVLARETVSDQQTTVFETSKPGWYAITISTEEESCKPRVSLTRVNSKLRQERTGLNTNACPVDFSVQMKLI